MTRKQFFALIYERAQDNMDSIKAADVESVCKRLESRFGKIDEGWECAIVDAAEALNPGDISVSWMLLSINPEELARANAYIEKCAGLAADIFGLYDEPC